MKKLLLLGGLRYLIPVIERAKEMGYHVITCDYLPESIAHKYSDEYYNISIIDKEAVLRLAQKLNIDGIMSFAVDPGVITAAYVAHKLNLPSCPLSSVEVLQNKALFREFLKQHDFNVPKAISYAKIEDALTDANSFQWPIIVKPVDAAGSKGVTKVEAIGDLHNAIDIAIASSYTNNFIIEEFIEAKGFASDSDCFSVNGEMQFVSFSSQRFDKNTKNPFTPSGYSWPSNISEKNQDLLRQELQRLVKLLNLGTSIYNIEVREGRDGLGYIMEVSPRGGGNRLSEMLYYATGIDLIECAIKAAMGEQLTALDMPVYRGNWTELILYSNNEGEFIELSIDKSIEKYVVETDLWIKKGDKVYPFKAANNAIGTLIFNFDNRMQVEHIMRNRTELVKIILK